MRTLDMRAPASADAALIARVAGAVRGSSDALGLSRAVLFGSVARGDHHPRSDVDIALVWPDGADEEFCLDAAISIGLNVEAAADMSCIPLPYTESEYGGLSAGLTSELEMDGIDLLTYPT
ncbi:MAG: nucleotidyltransferase domain-containing protein [bacterium]|nr:nucleotidyltransferase domain-containing protein [bacterium]